MKRILLLLCLTVLPYAAMAEDEPRANSAQTYNTYQIELIVFRNLHNPTLLDAWQSPPQINTIDGVELSLPDPATAQMMPNYSLLPKNKWQLNKEENRISHQSNYQILMHIAWTQVLIDQAQNKPVHVAGGKNYSLEGKVTNEVEGTISLSRNKFITFKTNLFITEPTQSILLSPDQHSTYSSLPPLLSYHLTQSRRMKSDELNYLDNPQFGMLVKITPLNGA